MNNNIISLGLWECSNESCNHAFYSSSDESMLCPSCGDNSLKWKGHFKAKLLEDIPSSSIKGTALEFFNERKLPLPDSIEIKMEWQYERNMDPWAYLSHVTINGTYPEIEVLEDSLKELINNNHSIEEMRENKEIEFNN